MADAAEAGSVFALPAELHREYIRMNLALRSNSVGNRLMSLVMCEHGGKKIVLLFVHPGHETQVNVPGPLVHEGEFPADGCLHSSLRRVLRCT